MELKTGFMDILFPAQLCAFRTAGTDIKPFGLNSVTGTDIISVCYQPGPPALIVVVVKNGIQVFGGKPVIS